MTRKYGNGSVYKRKDGRWVAQAYVTLVNGKKKRVSIIVKSREIAREKLREILAQKERQIHFSEKEWIIAEYLDYWMNKVQSKRVRETTFATYGFMIKNHIKPTLGGHKLRDLSVYNVQCAIEMMEKRGCSGATIQKCLRILSACLNYAMHEKGGQLVYKNVAQLVDKPEYTPKETMIWTSEQAAQFLSAIKDHPLFIAFLLLLAYGMRRGEALGLRWCDIDFDKGLIYLRQQIGRINGEIKARDLKTKNSRRVLYLAPVILDALLAHAEKLGITPPAFDPCFTPSTQGTVVVSEAGTPLEPRNLNRRFDILVEKIGLPRIKIHAMRHTAATMLKDLKVQDKDAQLILGHAKITTTQNLYQHGSPEVQRDAISVAADWLLNEQNVLSLNA